jgi:uncharacterized protein YndB with AHSA1/START domain
VVDISKDTTEIIIEPGRHDIVFKRVFDAPRADVFRALTDPELIPNWWGPSYLTTTVDAMEVRHGGRWRFVQQDAEGTEYAFRGVYHETTPERMIQTFEWEGLPGHVSLETLTLEEKDGKTHYLAVSVFQSVEDRDGMVASGMEAGMREGMLRLDEVIAGLLSRV